MNKEVFNYFVVPSNKEGVFPCIAVEKDRMQEIYDEVMELRKISEWARDKAIPALEWYSKGGSMSLPEMKIEKLDDIHGLSSKITLSALNFATKIAKEALEALPGEK